MDCKQHHKYIIEEMRSGVNKGGAYGGFPLIFVF